MVSLEAYSLEMTSPLHLGGVGIGMEESAETVPSDTLFSAICWGLREAEGAGWLQELLDSFHGSEPPFLISSTFPWAGGIRFLPRPMLPIPSPKDGGREGGSSAAPGKLLKRVAFVSEEIFARWIAGEELELQEGSILPDGLWLSPAESGQLPEHLARLPAEERRLWHDEEPVARVALDRVSARSALYHVGETRFSPQCGLWFAVRWNEPDWRDPFEAALSCLAEAGIGGERSSGRGQFRWERGETPRLPAPSRGMAVTLSLYHPTSEEVAAGHLDDALYRLLTRRGWVGSPEGQGWRGRPVRMLAEGSVLDARARGDLVDVTPVGFTSHPVYRYGMAFLVTATGGHDG